MRATDPLLASLGHCDPRPSTVNSAATTATSSNSAAAGAATATRCPDHKPFVGRFHACERRWKCDQVWQGGVGCYEWDEEYLDQIGKGLKKLVRPTPPSADASTSSVEGGSLTNLAAKGPLIVNVNPAEMPEWCWDEYRPQKEKEIRDWVESSRQGPAAVHAGGGGAAGPSRNRDKELSNDERLVPPDSLVRVWTFFRLRRGKTTGLRPTDYHTTHCSRRSSPSLGTRRAPSCKTLSPSSVHGPSTRSPAPTLNSSNSSSSFSTSDTSLPAASSNNAPRLRGIRQLG